MTWYQEWFGEEYLELYSHRDEHEAKRQTFDDAFYALVPGGVVVRYDAEGRPAGTVRSTTSCPTRLRKNGVARSKARAASTVPCKGIA